jgi:hypothetical protein
MNGLVSPSRSPRSVTPQTPPSPSAFDALEVSDYSILDKNFSIDHLLAEQGSKVSFPVFLLFASVATFLIIAFHSFSRARFVEFYGLPVFGRPRNRPDPGRLTANEKTRQRQSETIPFFRSPFIVQLFLVFILCFLILILILILILFLFLIIFFIILSVFLLHVVLFNR